MSPSAISESAAKPEMDDEDIVCDVCIVGAGPAGLMMADNLARFGIKSRTIDERPDKTSAGRADGLQPKTLETLRMLRLSDDLLRVSARVHDICIWGHDEKSQLKRHGREIHYPDEIVDVLDPYILLCHQGMVENMFLKAMRERGAEVERNTTFKTYSSKSTRKDVLEIEVEAEGREKVIRSRYLVGCDGARSKVRKAIPGASSEGSSSESVWGVLDGQVVTTFPDIWSKTIVTHPAHGVVLVIPRERGMTRFYIELKSDTSSGTGCSATQDMVMQQAKRICAPYDLEWTTVEWFGHYNVRQRVAARFSSSCQRAFIAGDAGHTHSPKAAQGMNTSIHDSWNLGWKLNLAVRGLAKTSLLETYELERGKIANDLIQFDYEHANQIAGGDAEALSKNFRTNMGFISGVGVCYSDNILTQGSTLIHKGRVAPGSILPPARATRYIDHNPVHVQLDIPVLGQFRMYFLIPDVTNSDAQTFLRDLSSSITEQTSILARLSQAARDSYDQKPRLEGVDDAYYCHDRYTAISDLFTPAIITCTRKTAFELDDLPMLFSTSRWTVYLDDTMSEERHQPKGCIEKWVGALAPDQTAIVNVRPDGYVGSVSTWTSSEAANAADWIMGYYDGFLKA